METGPGEPSVPAGQVRETGLRAVLEKAESALGAGAPAAARLDMYREFLRMEEKRLEEMEGQKKEVVRRDFYFDEAMNVTIDYLRALAGSTGLAETAKVIGSSPAAAPRTPAAVEQTP